MKSLAVNILLTVALLIFLALTLMPKVIGASIERAAIDNILAIILPEAESQFEIRRNEFSDGWFSSSTTIEFIFTPIGTDAIALTMDFDIDHGPLLQTNDGLSIGLAYAVRHSYCRTLLPPTRNHTKCIGALRSIDAGQHKCQRVEL